MTSVDPSLDDLQDNPTGLRDYAEREAQRANAATQELADLKRKDAFRDAGLNPTNPLHKAVIDGYAGDLDKVGDFVSTLGLNSPTEPDPIPTDEQDALNRAAGLTGGDSVPQNPEAEGNARLKAIVDQATREKWGNQRFNDEFTAEMTRQRRPVGSAGNQAVIQK